MTHTHLIIQAACGSMLVHSSAPCFLVVLGTPLPLRYTRTKIGQRVVLRLTPEIRFEYDDSLDQAEMVSAFPLKYECLHRLVKLA